MEKEICFNCGRRFDDLYFERLEYNLACDLMLIGGVNVNNIGRLRDCDCLVPLNG